MNERSELEVGEHASGSEAPKSGVRDARLLPPRPRPRALPGKEVLPAPGVPETPRRERNQTSAFWPAPPEPMKVPPARQSKRGTPLTTTTHGFPEPVLRAGAPAARRSRFVEVEPSLDPERAPPPPRSKRTFTDQGWPPPSGTIEPVRESHRDTKPLLAGFDATEPVSEIRSVVAEPVAPAPEARPARALAPRSAANDVALPSLFDDDPVVLPIHRSPRRAVLVAFAVAVLAAVVAAAALLR